MTDDSTTGRHERAAQNLREARTELEKLTMEETTLAILLISFLLSFAEEYLTEQYEKTKGRSPEA